MRLGMVWSRTQGKLCIGLLNALSKERSKRKNRARANRAHQGQQARYIFVYSRTGADLQAPDKLFPHELINTLYKIANQTPLSSNASFIFV